VGMDVWRDSPGTAVPLRRVGARHGTVLGFDHTFHLRAGYPSCPCYGWHHPLHDLLREAGVLQWDLARALHVLPLSLGAQLTRWKGGWTAQGRAAEAPTRQKDSSCGCRERCGGDDGVRNTAHAELTLTAAGTALPLSGVQQVVCTPARPVRCRTARSVSRHQGVI
jgi:hypothetical protein